MSDPDVEYHGMMADTWDLFRGDTSRWEDRPFYLEMIRESGEPALDVGCGTGRLLLDYLSHGVDIDGVDNSPDMLALCRQKASSLGLTPRLFEGSMESIRVPRLYQTIIVPSSSFQLLTDPAVAQKAIENLYSHLLPGGSLVMPFMLVRKRGGTLVWDWHLSGEIVRPGDGATVQRWSYSRFDPQTQLEHTEDRYEVLKDGEVISTEYHMRSPATREYTQAQAWECFDRAGLIDLQIYKGFTRQPADAEDEIFTLSGRKPA